MRCFIGNDRIYSLVEGRNESARIELIFGESTATLVLRLIWSLRFSYILEERKRLRLCSGNLKMVSPSGMDCSIQWLRRGALFAYFCMRTGRRSSTKAIESALKRVRMSAVTDSRIWILGT